MGSTADQRVNELTITIISSSVPEHANGSDVITVIKNEIYRAVAQYSTCLTAHSCVSTLRIIMIINNDNNNNYNNNNNNNKNGHLARLT